MIIANVSKQWQNNVHTFITTDSMQEGSGATSVAFKRLI